MRLAKKFVLKLLNPPLVTRIANNSKVVADDEFSRNFPKQGCQINITMRDGTLISDRQEDVVPFSDAQVVENFRYEAGRLFGDKQAEELTQRLSNLEEVEEGGKLARLFSRK